MNILNSIGLGTANKKVSLNKGISGLILAYKIQYELGGPFVPAIPADAAISIYVERANGANNEITNGFINLQQFIAISTSMADAVNSVGDFAHVAVCELTELGAIHLYEKDNIVIEFRNIGSGIDWFVRGIEEPATTDSVFSYNRKNMNSETTNQDFDVNGFDMVLFEGIDLTESTTTEIALTYDNGQKVTYHPLELAFMMAQVDPITRVNHDGTVTSQTGFLVLPLAGVISVNLRKETGTPISMLLRSQIN